MTAVDEGTNGSRGGGVVLRCYAELNDHLPRDQAGRALRVSVANGASVADILDRVGVPCHEVDLILVNGDSAPLHRRLAPGDRVAAYPVFEALDLGGMADLPGRPLRRLSFAADAHLGRLARYLRLLGLDVEQRAGIGDAELIALSRRGGRVVLSRDRALVHRSGLTRAYRVSATDPWRQACEVVARFDAGRADRPFSRCLCCNTRLRPASRAAVADRLLPDTCRVYDRFRECPGCRRIYWRGPHYRRMRPRVALLRRLRPGDPPPEKPRHP